MKSLVLVIALLSSCATVNMTPIQQCLQRVCPEAAKLAEAPPGGRASYDETDDTCLCIFRDGRIYITRRQ